MDLERLIMAASGPLVFGGLAAFFFLSLVAYCHVKRRALVELLNQAVALREKQQELKNRTGEAPRLEGARRVEKGVRALLAREGLCR